MIRALTRIFWRWRRLLLISSAVALSACASLPAQEMSDARQAVAAAAQSGGEQQSPAQMQAAREALAQAEMALKQFRYKAARRLAQQARAMAIEVQQVAAAH